MRFKIISILVFLIFSFSLTPRAAAQPPIDTQAPGFITATLDGEKVALKEYWEQKGKKVVVLSFFATWCRPCIDDLKYLQKIQKRYEDKGLQVVCILTQDPAKEKAVREFIKKLGVNLPVLLDEFGIIGKRYQVTVLPFNCLIDQEGVLRAAYLGYNTEVKQRFENELNNHIEKP